MSVTVGVVGAGAIARQMHLPVLCAIPEVRVAWVADLSVDRARETVAALALPAEAVRADPSTLPPCDVALLATPVGVRGPYYEELARRGTAVFAEKPFATRQEDHLRWASLFPPERVVCGFMRRTYETTRLLRTLVAESSLGPLREIVTRDGGRTGRTGTDRSFLDDPAAAGGGALLDYGSHSLDTALFVSHATSFELLSASAAWDGPIDRETRAHLRLDTPAGPVLLDFGVSWFERQPNTIELVFDRARIRAGLLPEAGVSLLGADGAPIARLSSAHRAARTPYQSFYAEWRSFLDGLSGGPASEIRAASAALTTGAVEAIYGRASVARP
ncbi:MAG TPA: Gfo/Idh/MocA family oxidoreductase [Candidatus Polarisedimenticolaceae bacterium]|nr:Gfo/Idh/MocA family oxidoreductase [Candidatus Polarisedimenticolaceae bacterium]